MNTTKTSTINDDDIEQTIVISGLTALANSKGYGFCITRGQRGLEAWLTPLCSSEDDVYNHIDKHWDDADWDTDGYRFLSWWPVRRTARGYRNVMRGTVGESLREAAAKILTVGDAS